MMITDNERFMELTLFNGTSYIEIENKIKNNKKPHRKITFYKELIRFDLSSFDIKNSELLYKGHYAMLNNYQLENSIDSLNNKRLTKINLISSRLNSNYHYKSEVSSVKLKKTNIIKSQKHINTNLIIRLEYVHKYFKHTKQFTI